MSIRDLLQRQRIFNAPMFGIADFAFRELCRQMGAEVTYGEMIAAEGFVRQDRGLLRRLDMVEGEPCRAMQLYGRDPDLLAEAGRQLQDRGAVLVDLNMGCPARNIVAGQAGSALLRDLPRVARIFKAMRAAIQIPFTVKVRWDWDGDATRERGLALEVARMAEAEGLDAIGLHARTRAQGYGGQARWEWIAALKAEVSIPVIGNGDIREPADALAMIAQTGCDAVMIGRALIGDPWLMRETLDAVKFGRAASGRIAPGWDDRRRMMLRHARMMHERRGERALGMFRKHAVAYLRGLGGVRAIRDRLMRVTTLAELEDALAAELDPNDSTPITVNTDEHEARLRHRP
jgi:nifR3 family TIM-barrel protein